MWRIVLLALRALTVAVSACEPATFNTAWGNGDYEVVALIAE